MAFSSFPVQHSPSGLTPPPPCPASLSKDVSSTPPGACQAVSAHGAHQTHPGRGPPLVSSKT